MSEPTKKEESKPTEKEGLVTTYYESGQLHSEENYKDGNLEGIIYILGIISLVAVIIVLLLLIKA